MRPEAFHANAIVMVGFVLVGVEGVVRFGGWAGEVRCVAGENCGCSSELKVTCRNQVQLGGQPQ